MTRILKPEGHQNVIRCFPAYYCIRIQKICKMSVSDLIKSINAVTSSGELNSIDEQQRAELSSACDRLKAMCESSLETMFRLLFTVCSISHYALLDTNKRTGTPDHGSSSSHRPQALRRRHPPLIPE